MILVFWALIFTAGACFPVDHQPALLTGVAIGLGWCWLFFGRDGKRRK